MVSSNGMFST
jgi:hypothetical protein